MPSVLMKSTDHVSEEQWTCHLNICIIKGQTGGLVEETDKARSHPCFAFNFFQKGKNFKNQLRTFTLQAANQYLPSWPVGYFKRMIWLKLPWLSPGRSWGYGRRDPVTETHTLIQPYTMSRLNSSFCHQGEKKKLFLGLKKNSPINPNYPERVFQWGLKPEMSISWGGQGGSRTFHLGVQPQET